MESPAPILDYAAPRRGLNWHRLLLTGLVCMLYGGIGALFGWAICPPAIYEATGMLEVLPIGGSFAPSPPPRQAFEKEMQRNVSAVSSPEHVREITQSVNTQGLSISPENIARSLRARAIPGTNLVTVTFRHHDARVACAVANAALEGMPLPPPPVPRESLTPQQREELDFRQTFGPGMRVINDGSVASMISFQRSYAAGGLAVGLLVGGLIVLYQQKRTTLPLLHPLPLPTARR